MYPHRIRLLGPWQYEPLARTVIQPDGRIEEIVSTTRPLPAPGRMKLPSTYCSTPLNGFRGRVRWRRKFHAPRELELHERLWLVFDGVDYFADVSLNDTPLGRHEGYFEPFDLEVTPLVGARNEIVVDVDCPAEVDRDATRLIRLFETGSNDRVGGIWNEVALEVRSGAFLRDVLVTAELDESRGFVTVTGRVVGEAGFPASLELSLDGVWQSGERLAPSPAGTEFRLTATLDSAPVWWPRPLGEPRTVPLELELHGNARTLDAVRRRVGFRQVRFDDNLASAEINGRRVRVEVGTLAWTTNPLTSNPKSLACDCNESPSSADTVRLLWLAALVCRPEFYDAADAAGWLVWQDFPLCGGFSRDPTFRDEAARQAASMVRRLSSHPCVAFWCCHAGATDHDAALDAAVKQAIASLDPTRRCIESDNAMTRAKSNG